jgi:hypothetical protein
VNAVFMEADQEGTHETVPALPAPRENKPRDVLEPARRERTNPAMCWNLPNDGGKKR